MLGIYSIKGTQLNIKVHNPGTILDRVWNYLNLSDISVIYEESFSNWLDRGTFDTLTAFQNGSIYPKSQLAVMLHSLPDLADKLLRCMVNELEAMAD